MHIPLPYLPLPTVNILKSIPLTITLTTSIYNTHPSTSINSFLPFKSHTPNQTTTNSNPHKHTLPLHPSTHPSTYSNISAYPIQSNPPTYSQRLNHSLLRQKWKEKSNVFKKPIDNISPPPGGHPHSPSRLVTLAITYRSAMYLSYDVFCRLVHLPHYFWFCFI